MEKKKYNPNLIHLIKSYYKKRYAVLEGSSRSGKTYAIIHWLIWFASNPDNDGKTIAIVRETATSFKTTLYTDFKKILSDFNIDNPFLNQKQVNQFKIKDTTIHFVGADDFTKIQGLQSDITWINEAINVDVEVFDQLEMRCKEFIILDYNPLANNSWIYDKVIPNSKTAFIRTTYKDNPYLEQAIVDTIESYNPDDPVNVKQGTADKWLWSVFGLGLRMGRTGLVFKKVEWIDKFPEDIERIGYGMDFGYKNDPSTLVKAGVKGNDLYLELSIYEPTLNATILSPMLDAFIKRDDYIFADSADPAFISDLVRLGHRVVGVKKFKGSISYGIGLINSYNIHIVINPNAKKEQENYVYKVVNGQTLDVPIDNFNHFWDAARYVSISLFRKNTII